MAGTVAGGKAAAETNRRVHGADFYSVIGAIGGRKGDTGGFYSRDACDNRCDLGHIVGQPHRIAQCAGYKGGIKSRRTKKS